MLTALLLRRPAAIGLGLGLSAALLTTTTSPSANPFLLLRPRPLLCEARSAPFTGGGSGEYAERAEVPVVRQGKVNPSIYAQLSRGSVFGLLGGVAVSTFSKPLTFFIGLFMLGVQFLESRGIHVIPRERLQRYFKSINVRSALEDNVAFKMSFGTTFMLAAFAQF